MDYPFHGWDSRTQKFEEIGPVNDIARPFHNPCIDIIS